MAQCCAGLKFEGKIYFCIHEQGHEIWHYASVQERDFGITLTWKPGHRLEIKGKERVRG